MINIDQQIGAVSRTVSEREVDGRLAKAITLAQTCPVNINDLWDAVSNPKRIPQWFAPVTGDLRAGGTFQIEGNASGTITACDPPNGFDATWEFGDALSWIEVRVTAVDETHTCVELTHLAYPDEHWEQFGPGAGGIGWDLALVGLSQHIGGSGNDPSEGMAWMGSPEGIQFMIASGRAWGDADIADGEDPAVAQAAVERTIAAYTQPPVES